MRPGKYQRRASAKVNLGLAVLTRRGDGFHEVETLMARTHLADDVEVEVALPGTGDGGVHLTVRVDAAAGPLPGADALAEGEDNLMMRAARAYLAAYLRAAEATGAAVLAPTLNLTLVKRVPVAAGLGGGSSDAAAVLSALQEADAGAQPGGAALVSVAERTALALELGSDVPFFLAGHPAALARGRGERLTPTTLPRLELVLVNPGLAVSAAEAYQQLVGFTPRLRTERALARLVEGLDPGWSNGLQPGVLRAHPEVREVLTALREAGLKGVIMSGSGATCFGVATAPEPEEGAADGSGSAASAVDAGQASAARSAAAAARALSERHPGWWVTATCTTLGG